MLSSQIFIVYTRYLTRLTIINSEYMNSHGDSIDITALTGMMARCGVKRLLAKTLAANDNSKNQIYLGSVLNLLPVQQIRMELTGGTRPRHVADIDFSWLTLARETVKAPHTKLILYPKYPEVRLSGFMRNCPEAPPIIARRMEGRTLFLGITEDNKVIGYVSPPESNISLSVQNGNFSRSGVLMEIPVEGDDSSKSLIETLEDISMKGWIQGKSLTSKGMVECNSPQCGGYTLEAEFGIVRNSHRAPDYKGWELKAYRVPTFKNLPGSKVISAITTEPDGGYYSEEGLISFVRKYGYEDRNNRPDRLNFGGVYRVGSEPHKLTGIRLTIDGFNTGRSGYDPQGKVLFLDRGDNIAASWSFTKLLDSWGKKHARAAYVPYITETDAGIRKYMYSSRVRLATGTNFRHFLTALDSGNLYLDPAHKITGYNTNPVGKARTQWRINSRHVDSFYDSIDTVSLGIN